LGGKLAKPGGVAEVLPGHERSFLACLPVGELPGVGYSIGTRLERFAIRTVGELALVPREVLFASFGRDGLTLFDRARALDPSPVEVTHAFDDSGNLVVRPPRSIRRETTFEPEEGRRELLLAMLSYLTERAASHLRRHGLLCGSIEVRCRWVDTRARIEGARSGGGGASAKKRRALDRPSDATSTLFQHARELFEGLPHRRALVKNIGLTLLTLRTSDGWQGQLFGAPLSKGCADEHGASRADRHRRLDTAVDGLRQRLGFGSVMRGSSAELRKTHALGPDGFRLRTPSLNQ
jgi:DNA polymerase-4